MFEELLADLDSRGVRFVVVGGLAVVIHGVARLTADIDLVIALDQPNVRRCVDGLTARGLRPLLPVNAADFEKVALAGRSIRVASLEHSIAMKKATARPQDLLDIEQLEQIRRRRGV